MHDNPHQLVAAAWLGAILERLRRGEDPFPIGNERAIKADRYTFGGKGAAAGPPAIYYLTYSHCPCPAGIDTMLIEMYERLEGTPKEFDVWSDLLFELGFLPPETIIEKLLDRNPPSRLVHDIGHCLLSDKLLWRLATQVDEALLTLAKRRFLNAEYDQYKFEEVLHAFPTHEWMLQSLAILATSTTEIKKRQVLAPYLARHKETARLLRGSTPDFQELVKRSQG